MINVIDAEYRVRSVTHHNPHNAPQVFRIDSNIGRARVVAILLCPIRVTLKPAYYRRVSSLIGYTPAIYGLFAFTVVQNNSLFTTPIEYPFYLK